MSCGIGRPWASVVDEFDPPDTNTTTITTTTTTATIPASRYRLRTWAPEAEVVEWALFIVLFS